MNAEGDKVWVRLAVSGGHTGALMGIAPTGRKWTGVGVGFCRIAHGRIAKIETLWNTLDQILPLGATIAPPSS
jgi:predicted ester cyclase